MAVLERAVELKGAPDARLFTLCSAICNCLAVDRPDCGLACGKSFAWSRVWLPCRYSYWADRRVARWLDIHEAWHPGRRFYLQYRGGNDWRHRPGSDREIVCGRPQLILPSGL